MKPSTQSLRREIDRALRAGAFDPTDVLPRLARLARLAAPESDDGVFANQKLAEVLAERHPWRAALYARRALAHREHDDRSWAVLAFCHTLLGHFRCAATAYKKAIACAPSNPWYAHNLGHLLDVALGQPARAIAWLKTAYEAKGDNSEIVASYVHALARADRIAEARRVLERARRRFDSKELDALRTWLDQGAPSRPRRESRPGQSRDGAALERLSNVLARGMSRLPLDQQQRERALALARDALPRSAKRRAARPRRTKDGGAARPIAAGPDDVAGLAAAVAYAIVYVDHVPLSPAEVAAPFRVGVADLRGRFAELRAKLDIIRGDARYATTHR